MDIENISKNKKILIDGTPFNVIDAEFVKPGKGRAIYRLKLRNLADGSTLDRTYHSGENVEEVHIEAIEFQYLYKEGDRFVFMNAETFEQIYIEEKLMGDKYNYLKEGTTVTLQMMGDKPLDISLPLSVELKVTKSATASKADTVTAQMKAVELETGLTTGVPTFVKEGDIIKVDTRTGNYIERVTKK